MYFTVDLIFHLLNFSLLILISFYLFKKYVVVKIKHDMTARELMLSILYKRRDALRKQEQHIAVAYTNQQLLYEELSRKVAKWRSKVLAEERERHAALTYIEQQIVARYQERAIALEQAQIKALVIPQAVVQARAELQHYFNPARKDRYVQKIIQSISQVTHDASS